jgi:hypothetical protein
VTTKVEQTSKFSSVADITSSATGYIQNNVNTSTTHTKVTTSEGPLFTAKETTFSYPITVNLDEEVLDNGNITEVTSVDQKLERDETDSFLGFPVFKSSTTNEVKPTDSALFVLTPNGYELGQNSDQSSSQTYIYRDSFGQCYNRTLTAAANVLTGVEDKHVCK